MAKLWLYMLFYRIFVHGSCVNPCGRFVRFHPGIGVVPQKHVGILYKLSVFHLHFQFDHFVSKLFFGFRRKECVIWLSVFFVSDHYRRSVSSIRSLFVSSHKFLLKIRYKNSSQPVVRKNRTTACKPLPKMIQYERLRACCIFLGIWTVCEPVLIAGKPSGVGGVGRFFYDSIVFDSNQSI